MEKYTDIFRTFKKFVSKKDIVDKITEVHTEEISDYTYKKMVDYFLSNGIITEVSEKRKKFFITTDVVKQKGISASDYFYAEKLGITAGKTLKKASRINYDDYLQSDAVIVNNELLAQVI